MLFLGIQAFSVVHLVNCCWPELKLPLCQQKWGIGTLVTIWVCNDCVWLGWWTSLESWLRFHQAVSNILCKRESGEKGQCKLEWWCRVSFHWGKKIDKRFEFGKLGKGQYGILPSAKHIKASLLSSAVGWPLCVGKDWREAVAHAPELPSLPLRRCCIRFLLARRTVIIIFTVSCWKYLVLSLDFLTYRQVGSDPAILQSCEQVHKAAPSHLDLECEGAPSTWNVLWGHANPKWASSALSYPHWDASIS